MTYKLTTFGSVTRLTDGASIPVGSPDYAAYLAWVEAGNVPEPADVPAPPTPLQKITALETANPITHRMLRDLSMTVAQIAAAVTGTDPLVNPAVQQIVALEAQIAALRAQL